MDKGVVLEISSPKNFYSNPMSERAEVFLSKVLHYLIFRFFFRLGKKVMGDT